MSPEIDDGLQRLLDTLSSEAGLSLDPTRFENRLRIQKTIYLLNQLGSYPTNRFEFTNYVRGPYSPGLARMYYGKTRWDEVPLDAWTPKEDHLRLVTSALERGSNFLEAAATLHSLSRRNPGASKASIIEHATELKPHLKAKFGEVWDFLEEHELIHA